MTHPGDGPGRGRRRGQAGFSMVEMLVLVAIIGILASIATASYLAVRNKARTVEARLALHTIYNLEIAHQKDTGAYSADLNAIGFRMLGAPRYTYSVAASPASFTATAVANLDLDADLDTWVVYSTSPEAVRVTRD